MSSGPLLLPNLKLDEALVAENILLQEASLKVHSLMKPLFEQKFFQTHVSLLSELLQNPSNFLLLLLL